MRGSRIKKKKTTPDTHVHIPGTRICVILITPDVVYILEYICLLVLALLMFMPR